MIKIKPHRIGPGKTQPKTHIYMRIKVMENQIEQHILSGRGSPLEILRQPIKDSSQIFTHTII